MKKIIYSLLVLAMTAFTFSSCEDVPAPYDTPNQPEKPEITTDGSEANPYTIADAKLAGSGTNVFVKAYIVGFVPDKTLSEAIFGATGETVAVSNVIIAASPDETNINNCMPVQLPTGDVRSALNLKDNPGNLKQEVLLCGNIENYFGATGLKSVVWAKIGSKEIGTKPGTDTPSAGEAKGDGTEANPFNSVAAQKLAASLTADQATEQTYYIKGKIQKIADNGEYNANYGNASFYIADDANSTQFYVFRVYYYEGKKWVEGNTQIKVGDEVVVCCKLVNYKGNTPETSQGGSLISLNGKTSDGSVDPTPDPTPAGDGMTASAINSGKVGDNALQTKVYGSQNTTEESTWYSWKFDNVTYKGTKICISDETQGKGIQMQGNASDESKQGFIFNATAFSKEIKTITVYLSTLATAKYAPSYSLYAAKSANGRDTKVTGTSTNETADNWKTYTEVYDLSAYNTKYFTLWNNTVGALYIEKIVVTLK